MIRRTILAALMVWVCVSFAYEAFAQTAGASRIRLPPRNVIIVIGDGMDSQQISIARNYLVGATGELNIDRLPIRSTAKVLTVEEQAPHAVAYVADSANSGSSISSGIVTSTGRIATQVGTGEAAPTILELAKAAGYRTGVVTTATVSDATPAAFLAHSAFRLCEGPEDMMPGGRFNSPGCNGDLKANGGQGSIAEQIAAGNADVVMGGGGDKFAQAREASDQTVGQLARKNGFLIVSTPAELNAVSKGRVLGLFSPGTLPVRLSGPAAGRATFDDDNNPIFPPVATCSSNPEFGKVPSLATMTAKAVELLSRDNDKGFVLMVESASIDKQSHARNPCGQIGELEQLDEVVALVRSYMAKGSGTLLLVTADHGHAAQLLPETTEGGGPRKWPPPVAALGYIGRVMTREGSVMKIGYATSNGVMEEHSGVEIPVMALGDRGFVLKPVIAQRDLFSIMKQHLRLQLGTGSRLLSEGSPLSPGRPVPVVAWNKALAVAAREVPLC